MISLLEFNGLPLDSAKKLLLSCCGSQRWAEKMVLLRPFKDLNDLTVHSVRVWQSLSAEDWLEAFRCHPKIGALRKKEAHPTIGSVWEAQEQNGVVRALGETLRSLESWNRQYEDKFGHVFLVCATGKTADQMLELLKQRIQNSRDQELQIARGEQEKITHIRLEKLIYETSNYDPRTRHQQG